MTSESSNLTPRAIRWAETLLDLASTHHNAQLKKVALRITKEYVQLKMDLTPEEETIILQISVEALRNLPDA